MVKVRTKSVGETHALAGAIAPLLRAGDLLILSGDLGGGKTAFVQGLAASLGITEPVTSPTFVLAQIYEGPMRLHHLDAYRLNSPAEMIDLAVPELLADRAVTAIEWGERFLDELPPDYLQISFGLGDVSNPPDVREIDLHPAGAWTAREEQLREATRRWARD